MAPPMKPSREEMLATTFNAKLAKQGAKTRKLAESRDVNTMPDPKTYAAVMGLLGERPDEMGFSIAHPKYKEIMDVADPAFALGTAAQVVPLVKPAGQAVRGAAKALAPKAGQMVMKAAEVGGMPVQGLGVVKNEGGNWLGGSMMGNIDRSVKRLTPTGNLGGSIKTMKSQLASLENSGGSQRAIDALKDDIAYAEKDQAIYNWVTRNLGNYVKKEMGTPSDPVRRLADEGIVHAPHGEFVDPEAPGLASKRSMAGFPIEGMAKSTEAANWEDLSDRAINSIYAGEVQKAVKNTARGEQARKAIDAFEAELPAKFEAYLQRVGDVIDPVTVEKLRASSNSRKADLIGQGDMYRQLISDENLSKLGGKDRVRMLDTAEENPWIEKLPPTERLYSGDVSELGFDHIIDVLRQDVREGRIRPEQLSKVSMEQAVRRTYEYDQEMARKLGSASIKDFDVFPTHKEYPEGYRWIELTKPAEKADWAVPENFEIVKPVPHSETWAIRDKNTGKYITTGLDSPERAAAHLQDTQNTSRLEQALKFEGDSMGHCVGGYCPDVLEGRSRIYSLRDAKGQPHVTVEVNPREIKTWDDVTASVGKDEAAKLWDEFDRIGGHNMDNTDAAFDMFIKQKGIQPAQSIRQIKGKQNKAPIEDYLPYVQDFVRSGNWSKVGDFHNTGLIRKSDLIDKFTPDQLDAIGKGEYLTKGEYDDLILKALRPPEEGMKAGGEVKMKEGGIKETPVKNKAAHGMSKALGAVHKFASEPFGYKNPPGEIVSEMLGIPATARTLERMGYGEPLTTGKGMTAKPRADTMDALMAVAPLAPITKGMPVGAVIKPKGGNWLTGDVENAVARLKSPTTAGETPAQRIPRHEELLRDPSLTPESRATVEMHLNAEKKRAALDKWVDSNLTNYIKNQMATPDDPVRKLAEEGITHKSDLNNYRRTAGRSVSERRVAAGFPIEGMGQSELGRVWENLADYSFMSKPAKDVSSERYPWVTKLDPETPVYGGIKQDTATELAFDHIIDVLREDLAAGRIRPEQLSKVSMEQAVRRTYEYDQELAKKMAQARIASREGLPVYKEYPEGYRWIELNRPGSFAQESEAMGHSVRGYEPPTGHPDWIEGSGGAGNLGYGHGGWEAIKSGKAKVYSLVDPNGNSHVTVEVKAKPTYTEEDVIQQFPGGVTDAMRAGDVGGRNYIAQKLAEINSSGSDVITQVKGKQNAAPKEEYLPFVQDFVRSSGMSVERDLQNTGLRDINREGSIKKYLEEKGVKFDRYIPEKEFNQYQDDYLMDRLYPPDDPRYPPLSDGMKAGGEVKMGIGGVLALGKGAQKAEKGAQVIKASEAFGAHEGLPVYITQSDRTKVGQGFLGGPGFSGLQHTSEPHREARAAWGVKTPGVANTIVGDPAMGKNPLFTTMIGSPTQHQSNQMVFDKMYRQFKNEAKKGNLSDELRFMINDKLAKAVDKDGKNVFPPNVDILSKDFHKMADTFDRRSIAGHLMGGVGIGGKKGQIIDYDKIIKGTTDPGLIDAPSGAIGNRIFTLDKNIINRPDLHPAFPTIMTGEDMNVMYNPVPRELFMQDFINQVRNEKGRNPGYLDYIRGRPPSQFISEDWLTKLQKEGHKKGGLLKVKRKK